jgi:hypothetical protein
VNFLGGLDLGTPEERQRRILTQDLELQRMQWVMPEDGGYIYQGGCDYVLKHGEFRMGRPLPEEYEQLRDLANTCFLNAMLAAQQDPTLRYCEGYATIGKMATLAHAWCIDAENKVVELTWPTRGAAWSEHLTPNLPSLPPDRWAYYGVILHPELIEWAWETLEEVCLLGRTGAENGEWRRRGMDAEQYLGTPLPLLKVPYDPDRRSL